MSESTLRLDDDGEGFVLRRTVDGNTSELPLSADDVLTLSQSAQAFRERVLSRHDPEGGNARAVYATHVVQVGLDTEAIGERVLLTLV
jgi:hypothetical protein